MSLPRSGAERKAEQQAAMQKEELLSAWLAQFNKLATKCVLFDEEGALYTAGGEGEAQTIDAASQKAIRQFVEKCAEQILEEFCDERGRIKKSVRQALQLDFSPENNLTEERILEMLIKDYLSHQALRFILGIMSAIPKEQLNSPGDKSKMEAAYQLKKYELMRQHFMKVLTEQIDSDHSVLLTPRVLLQTGLLDLAAAIQERSVQCGKDDPLYIASVEAYSNACDLARQILRAGLADKNELHIFNDLVREVAALIRNPRNGAAAFLFDCLQNAPVKKSSTWAKLSVGVLYVLGVSGAICGLDSTAISGGLDFGVFAGLGCKITEACFASAAALWSGCQLNQASALTESFLQVVASNEKREQETPLITAPDPAMPINLKKS